jgi:hypothetical protein
MPADWSTSPPELAFGLRGTIERVTNRVFLLSPAQRPGHAEDKAKIAEGGLLQPELTLTRDPPDVLSIAFQIISCCSMCSS